MPSTEKLLEDARVGGSIRSLRIERGITLAELCGRIGCSKGHLSNIESGRSTASTELRLAIAEALSVSLERIEGRAA